MQLARVVVEWSGPAVKGRAVNVLHFDGSDSQPDPAAIKAAYQVLSDLVPAGTNITIPGSGDLIEDTTGDLAGTWTSAGPQTMSGGVAVRAIAGAGMCVTWTTGGIVPGKGGVPRRLRGRTFLVPISGDLFEQDGTPAANCLTAVNLFATNLRAAGPLAVWHRPTTVGGADGNSYGVVSHKISDRAAFLKSRRD